MSDSAITAEAAAEGGHVLALRVLELAILDATSAPIPRGRARSHCWPVADEQREAVRFLTEPAGEWAAARAWWCDLAGVSAEWLQLCFQHPMRSGNRNMRNEFEPKASPGIKNNGL